MTSPRSRRSSIEGVAPAGMESAAMALASFLSVGSRWARKKTYQPCVPKRRRGGKEVQLRAVPGSSPLEEVYTPKLACRARGTETTPSRRKPLPFKSRKGALNERFHWVNRRFGWGLPGHRGG